MPISSYLLTAFAAYLLGSIPTGYLVARARGVDIRTVGSGNIGATNALRVLGKRAGITVLVLDALKGFIAAAWLAEGLPPLFNLSIADPQAHQVLAGVCAVLGHNYTCWLRFKGGKGIATTAGVYLALAPLPLLIALGVFLLGLLLTRYVSVGSIAAAVALPVAVWMLKPHAILLAVATTALGVLAIYKHAGNIQRLLAGTESRMGKKTQDAK